MAGNEKVFAFVLIAAGAGWACAGVLKGLKYIALPHLPPWCAVQPSDRSTARTGEASAVVSLSGSAISS